MYCWSLNNMGWNYAGPLVQGFFSINTCTAFNPWLGVCGSRGPTICLIYTILYKGLQHLQILVSAWVLEPVSHRYRETTKFLGSQKLHVDFWLSGGSVPLTSMFFKGQLYNVNTFFKINICIYMVYLCVYIYIYMYIHIYFFLNKFTKKLGNIHTKL